MKQNVDKSTPESLLDAEGKPKNYTKNKFEVQHDGKVIYDKATGLMWQQSGSEEYMTYDEARNYITKLNHDDFADYNDWRLPTLEEAMSLMEPARNEDGLYIDPLFDNKQAWIWTSDLYSVSSAWCVHFINGGCGCGDISIDQYVRAVR